MNAKTPMTEEQKLQLLETAKYVKNTGLNASREDFYDDHDPIGELLWRDLQALNFVSTNENGKIYLSEAGEKFIAENP